MVCRKFILLAVLLLSGPAWAAEPACAPPPGAGARNARIEAALKQFAESTCRSVALETKPQGSPSIVQVLTLFFSPPRKGGDRLKPKAPAGMPTGAVLPVNGRIDLDAGEVAGEGLVSLDIDGPQLAAHLRPPPANGLAQVPAAQLQQGAEYLWVLTTRRQRYEGAFTLADDETSKRVRGRLEALSKLNVDTTARLLLEAAIYDDEELVWSRDRAIALLRRGQ